MYTDFKYNQLINMITDKVTELLKTPNIELGLMFGKCGELTVIKVHRNKDNSYIEFGPNLRPYTKYIKSIATEDIINELRELIVRTTKYGSNGGGLSHKYTFAFPDNYQLDLFNDNSFITNTSYIPYKFRHEL